MIILDQTTDTIEIILGAVKTTNDMQILSCWRDISSTDFIPGRTPVVSNGVTAVTAVAAPDANHRMVVDMISVYNTDTAAKNVTVRLNANTVMSILWFGSLSAGELVVYNHRCGFRKLNNTGVLLRGGATVPAVDVQSFTSPGGGLWIKPIAFDPKIALVIVIGAGGGGGAGIGAQAASLTGGGGGGGGAYAEKIFTVADLGATEPVRVGYGGIGGSSTVVTVSSPRTGMAGESSIFGVQGQSNYVMAGGGGGGGSGISANASGGGGGGVGSDGMSSYTSGTPTGYVAIGGFPAPSATAAVGGGGGSGSVTSAAGYAEYGGAAGGGHVATAPVAGGSSLFGGGGGGCGNCTDGAYAVVAATAGGVSGSIVAGGGGAAATGSTGIAGTDGANGNTTKCGAGGGGGGHGSTVSGGKGGNGGTPGGGGGGGGTCYNVSGTRSGAGGKGGDGAVYVICW